MNTWNHYLLTFIALPHVKREEGEKEEEGEKDWMEKVVRRKKEREEEEAASQN